MKILAIHESFNTSGGAEYAIKNFLKYLSNLGDFKVKIVTNYINQKTAKQNPKLNVIYVSNLHKFPNPHTVNIITKLISKTDIVYIPRYVFWAIKLAKKYKKPSIIHLHDFFYLCPLSVLFNIHKQKICEKYQTFHVFQCIAKYRIKQHSYGIYSKKTDVIFSIF